MSIRSTIDTVISTENQQKYNSNLETALRAYETGNDQAQIKPFIQEMHATQQAFNQHLSTLQAQLNALKSDNRRLESSKISLQSEIDEKNRQHSKLVDQATKLSDRNHKQHLENEKVEKQMREEEDRLGKSYCEWLHIPHFPPPAPFAWPPK